MAVEIEAKMKVEDFDAVRRRLTELGAHHVGAVLETNTFFDTPDRSLLAAEKGLRLRRTQDISTGEKHYVITVKGPQQKGPLKSREEAEVSVSDGDRAADVLRMLGYEPTLSFEKKRESWTLADCKIELDQLPIFGRFVEIEGPGEEAVMRVRETLHLANRELIKTGYISMLANYLREHGDKRRAITF
jgi:adenylate cyclase class 2